jgi:ribulose-5-phosphate 4-epimerase/fuculose-1-phosphate aldolase
MFYDDLSVYTNFGGVVFAAEEGVTIAKELGKNKNLVMQNHGLLTCGGTVAEAAAFFIALERACQAQLLVHAALASGQVKTKLVGDEEARYTKEGTGNENVMYIQFIPEWELIVKETNGDFLD